MKDFYNGADDEGGVHINSGIPNHAFDLFARAQ
jgi:Zn-dependent metalloprotease